MCSTFQIIAHLHKLNSMDSDTFILPWSSADIETETASEVVKNLEQLAFKQGIASIYKTCDTIESLEESLNTLLYDDHNFKIMK
jgi:hypothetical protein